MGKRNENIITVIDLGSAKTVALAVETTEAGLRYRGHGIAPSAGTKRGVIVDLESAGKERVGSGGARGDKPADWRWSRRWLASAVRTSVRSTVME